MDSFHADWYSMGEIEKRTVTPLFASFRPLYGRLGTRSFGQEIVFTLFLLVTQISPRSANVDEDVARLPKFKPLVVSRQIKGR